MSVSRLVTLLGAVAILVGSTVYPTNRRVPTDILYLTAMAHQKARFFAVNIPQKGAVPPPAPLPAAIRLDGDDPASQLYRTDRTRSAVVDFFVDLAGSEEVALPMIYHADRFGIPLTLAFSLAWAESRFLPRAVNRNATSIDRGVFQLNSLTFPHLTETDFFHPEVNAYHAMRHFHWCLSEADGAVETALAIYNAGLARVARNQTPAITLVYVGRITAYREALSSRFRQFIAARFPDAEVRVALNGGV